MRAHPDLQHGPPRSDALTASTVAASSPLLDALCEHARQCGSHGAVEVGAMSASIIDERTGSLIGGQRTVASTRGAALRLLGVRYLTGALRGAR